VESAAVTDERVFEFEAFFERERIGSSRRFAS
jgi:hypothetical protein